MSCTAAHIIKLCAVNFLNGNFLVTSFCEDSHNRTALFTLCNKMFVVSFFRNIAFQKFLSAKAIKFVLWFWYILPACNQFDIFLHSIEGKSIEPVQKSGLAFFLHCLLINKKNIRSNASFLGCIFSILLLFLCFFVLRLKRSHL